MKTRLKELPSLRELEQRNEGMEWVPREFAAWVEGQEVRVTAVLERTVVYLDHSDGVKKLIGKNKIYASPEDVQFIRTTHLRPFNSSPWGKRSKKRKSAI